MSRKNRKKQHTSATDAVRKARKAVKAGDAREAERWSRVADRMEEQVRAPPPASDDEMDDETWRGDFLQRLEQYRDDRLEETRAKQLKALWWETRVWNEIRAGAGLAPLAAPTIHDVWVMDPIPAGDAVIAPPPRPGHGEPAPRTRLSW